MEFVSTERAREKPLKKINKHKQFIRKRVQSTSNKNAK